jgi:predicted transcriptional regulator
MNTTTFMEGIKEDILKLLTDGPLDSAQIQAHLNTSYQSTRRAIVMLEEESRVVKFDRKTRNARYTLGSNVGPKAIIPYVRFENKDFKLTDLTDYEGLVALCAEAGNDIMRSWTAIAITAQRLATGVPEEPLAKRLQAQKHTLGQARNRLENITFLINQMIENPKLWDIAFLQQFIDDKDWGAFLPKLDHMWHHYYGGTNEDGN